MGGRLDAGEGQHRLRQRPDAVAADDARRDVGRERLGPGRVQAVPHEAHQAAEVGTEVKGDGHGHGQLDAGGGAGAREVACHVDGDGGGEEGDAEVEAVAVAGQGAQVLNAQDGHVADLRL